MNKGELSSIRQGIYLEKLENIMLSLQQFEKNKNQFFVQIYSGTIDVVFTRMDKNNTELRNQMNEFIKVLNLQYSFLSKLKKDDKPAEISSVFKEFKQFTEQFGVIRESLLELNDFLGKFMGVTSYEFTELKRIYEQSQDLKARYEQYKSKMNQNYIQKKEAISSKKNTKRYFELAKIRSFIADVAREKEDSNEASTRLHSIVTREVNCKAKMYKDICDNLDYISALYKRSFKEHTLQKIKGYFKQRSEGMAKDRHELAQIKLDTDKAEKAFKEVQQQFDTMFSRFIDEITVARWQVVYCDKQGKQQKQRHLILLVTFDGRIVLYREQQREIIIEVSLQELKVYKPSVQGAVQIKNKKSKQRFTIRFSTVEQEDEFYLHYERVLQMD